VPAFPPTRWSLVVAARESSAPEMAAAAFEAVCLMYSPAAERPLLVAARGGVALKGILAAVSLFGGWLAYELGNFSRTQWNVSLPIV